MIAHSIGFLVALALLVPGFFMAFVPMLPALSYMFVVSLIFALYDKFTTLTGKELMLLLCITALSIVVDHTSGLLGAKYGGAHTKSLLWGMLGAFIGIFVFPGPGSLIGLFLGVFIAEMYYGKRHEKAIKAASGALIGSAVGVAVNVVLSLAFIATFFFLAFK